MMLPKIRKAKNKDASVILKLFNSDSNLTSDDKLQYDKNQISEYITNPVNKLFVYETDGKIVGAVLSEFWKKAKYVYVNILIVDKNYRRKGIGHKLMKYVRNLAKKEGMNLIFFYSEESDKEMHELAKKENYHKGKKLYFFSKRLK